MALPKVEAARHNITLPVSGKKLSFRPYLVREQKILLQAFELNDVDQYENAIYDIINAVSSEKVDELPLADFEFLMLNVRAKSSGELLELRYKCKNIIDKKKIDPKTKDIIKDENGNDVLEQGECATPITFGLKIGDITVHIPERDNKVMVSETIGIKLKDLTYSEYRNLKEFANNNIETNLKLLSKYIECVFDAETVYSDFTEVEVLEFIEQLRMDSIEKIQEYIEKTPILKHEFEMVCPRCGNKEIITLQGLDDFLT
jgi:hypothetical protein